ncbi:MAG: hypothetical protein ACLTSZ_03760 [Lachnospiraceae bacterium]
MRDTEEITRQVILNTPLTAPVKAGHQVGSVHYFLDGEEVAGKSDPGSCKRGSGRWHLVYKANSESVFSVMKQNIMIQGSKSCVSCLHEKA